jgi:AraC-like DNA-binding protein
MSSTSFDFDYRAREPAPPLRRAVASIWYARGTVPYRRERISPTGETFAVGIVATSVGCRSVFGLEPAAIAGRVVDLEETWPTAKVIRSALLGLIDPEAMLDLVADRLAEGVDQTDPGLGRCERAIAVLGDDPTLPIADVARLVGLSHGHLDREFTRIVGLSPRRLARLLRVQRLLEGIDAHGDVAWANLAADLGWSDQSHLIRDVKRHTGVSPSRYVAAQRAWMSPGDSPTPAAFVPEPM